MTIVAGRSSVLDGLGFWIHNRYEFLFLKRGGNSRTDYNQEQEAGSALIQQCYSNGIVAELCCFSFLCFLDSNYIHKDWVYSCINHFNMFIFVVFSLLCDMYGKILLFPHHFSSALILLAFASIDSFKIFYINKYNVFFFTMVTIPFASNRDLMVLRDQITGSKFLS